MNAGIDWILTTWDGSRRAQLLRRWCSLTLAVSFVCVAGTSRTDAAERTAREIAMEAFYAVERAPFDGLEKAAAAVARAAKLDPKEPWVYIAAARVQLRSGYRSGDGFDAATYDPDAIEAAHASAKRAVQLGPELIAAHNELGRILIILRDFHGAAVALTEAGRIHSMKQADAQTGPGNLHVVIKKDFHTAYLAAQLRRTQRDLKTAMTYLDNAEKLAEEPYQHSYVNAARIDVAYAMRDMAAVERFHQRAIELAPDSAYSYGNYGHFLLEQGRYLDAVVQLEKAVAIRPYGLAVNGLKRARLMRDSATK